MKKTKKNGNRNDSMMRTNGQQSKSRKTVKVSSLWDECDIREIAITETYGTGKAMNVPNKAIIVKYMRQDKTRHDTLIHSHTYPPTHLY